MKQRTNTNKTNKLRPHKTAKQLPNTNKNRKAVLEIAKIEQYGNKTDKLAAL